MAAALNAGDGVAAADVGGDDEVTQKEKLLVKADQLGKFVVRGIVGGWWAKALVSDPRHKADYVSCGRSYDKQRAFRQRWVGCQRVATKSNVETDGVTVGY